MRNAAGVSIRAGAVQGGRSGAENARKRQAAKSAGTPRKARCVEIARAVGLPEGSTSAVEGQPEAHDRDIVLTRIGPEVTLKRYQRIDAETMELQPISTNPEHEPIRIGPTTEGCEIVGIVVGAIVGNRREPG